VGVEDERIYVVSDLFVRMNFIDGCHDFSEIFFVTNSLDSFFVNFLKLSNFTDCRMRSFHRNVLSHSLNRKTAIFIISDNSGSGFSYSFSNLSGMGFSYKYYELNGFSHHKCIIPRFGFGVAQPKPNLL